MDGDLDRVDAVNALISTVRRRFPEKGFSLSDKLRFVRTDDKGICIHARVPIEKDETLMVLPVELRLGRERVLNDGGGDKKTGKTLQKLRRAIETNGKKFNKHQRYLDPDDFLLAVSIMRVLALKCGGGNSKDEETRLDINVAQAATWPSEAEMKESSWYYWDVDRVREVWNHSHLFFSFEELRSHVRSTFDDVLCPFFKSGRAQDYIDRSLPSNASVGRDEDALWNTFVYSVSLQWSRSHEGKDGRGPVMIPLVELFNGHSTRIDQVAHKKLKREKTVINVDIARGKWPFIRGRLFKDECNLPCSSVYASRDIDEGEELILTYGNLSPTDFAGKYGFLPPDFLHHHNVMSSVALWTPPRFIPTERLRVKCLAEGDCLYPLESFRKGDTPLCYLVCDQDDIEAYRAGLNEPDDVKSTRHYLILAVMADDFELNRNIATGKIRGPLYESGVLLLMCQVVDYNLAKLTGDGEAATSAEDVERAMSDGVPSWERNCLLARVAYRESLLMWRHAFSERRKFAMDFGAMNIGGRTSVDEDEDEANANVGCRMCGRSYPSMRCSRCQSVKYCSRGHQLLDWKEHKSQCGQ